MDIDGVQIVNTISQKYTGLGFDWFGVIFGVMGIGCIILAIYLVIKEHTFYHLAYGGVTAMMCLAGCFMAFNTANLGYYDRYEVLIDDSVSFVEFTNKYEVVDRHGDLYVVDPIEKEIYQKPKN